MKKTVRLMAAMAVLLTASGCSQDDLMPDGGKGKGTGAVGVTTFVANGARGVALNNTQDLIDTGNGFDLFAYESDETQFMGTETDGIEFAYNGGWDYVNAGEVKFWRQVTDGNTVDFYAVSPANTATPTIGYDAQTINYTVADNSADQKDLMYAKTLGVDPKNQSVIDNGVHLDFYHALSQIVFKARTTDEYITANVEEVEIVNLHNAGTFTFANAAYEDYTAEVTPWEITGATPEAAYLAEIPDAKVTGIKADATDLTTSATALLLLPQEVKGAVTPDKTKAPEDGGTYVRVKCHVTYQGTTDETATDIYGTEGAYENLYIPLTSEWKAGYKYIYTIVFSKDISDPVTINEDLYVGPWYEDDANNSDIFPEESLPAMSGAGTVEDPYLIWTAEQLATVRDNINNNGSSVPEGGIESWKKANYKLMMDIDLSTVCNETVGSWTPISSFEGTLDGNEKTLSNFYMVTTSGYEGLIEYLYGTVKNLNVEGYFEGGTYCGAIVGHAYEDGEVENCSYSGTYTGSGIVGLNDGKITNCINHATGTDVGGGISELNEGTIIGCYNYGSCTNVEAGIVGSNYGRIEDCHNYGALNIGEEVYMGGIVYTNFAKGIIVNCSNHAEIIGKGYVGSIVNDNKGLVIACYNEGTVTGTGYHGGICGDNDAAAKIIACYNVGNINETEEGWDMYVGGIVGFNAGTISACYNTGAITGTTNGGGIVGLNDYSDKSFNTGNAYVKYCYYTSSLYEKGINDDNGAATENVSGTDWSDLSTIINSLNTGITNCGVAEAAGWSYEVNTDEATKATMPLVLKYTAPTTD